LCTCVQVCYVVYMCTGVLCCVHVSRCTMLCTCVQVCYVVYVCTGVLCGVHVYRFAMLCTCVQVCYVVDAFLSPYVLLSSSTNDVGSARCIVMSLFLHYFFLAQFAAITVQVTPTATKPHKTVS